MAAIVCRPAFAFARLIGLRERASSLEITCHLRAGSSGAPLFHCVGAGSFWAGRGGISADLRSRPAGRQTDAHLPLARPAQLDAAELANPLTAMDRPAARLAGGETNCLAS